jgi:hypothetical protein
LSIDNRGRESRKLPTVIAHDDLIEIFKIIEENWDCVPYIYHVIFPYYH